MLDDIRATTHSSSQERKNPCPERFGKRGGARKDTAHGAYGRRAAEAAKSDYWKI